jgi:hypothetical protein
VPLHVAISTAFDCTFGFLLQFMIVRQIPDCVCHFSLSLKCLYPPLSLDHILSFFLRLPLLIEYLVPLALSGAICASLRHRPSLLEFRIYSEGLSLSPACHERLRLVLPPPSRLDLDGFFWA